MRNGRKTERKQHFLSLTWQMSHRRPITLALHSHWPVRESQISEKEPLMWQWQAAEEEEGAVNVFPKTHTLLKLSLIDKCLQRGFCHPEKPKKASPSKAGRCYSHTVTRHINLPILMWNFAPNYYSEKFCLDFINNLFYMCLSDQTRMFRAHYCVCDDGELRF